MPEADKITLHLHVCPECGHVVDRRDSTPARGCFGNRVGGHARSERIEVDVDVVHYDGVVEVLASRGTE